MTKQIELQLGETFEIKVDNHITTWKMVTQFNVVRSPPRSRGGLP
jgi:hypothetical protein